MALQERLRYQTDPPYGSNSRRVFKDLLSIRTAFESHFKDQSSSTLVDADFKTKFHSLFWVAVAQLERVAKLRETAGTLTDGTHLIEASRQILGEAETTLGDLTRTFEQLATIDLTTNVDNWDTLRQDLDSKLGAALAVEQELRGIAIDPNDVRQYLD